MLLTLELSKNVNSACRTVMNSGIYTMCKLCDSSVVVLLALRGGVDAQFFIPIFKGASASVLI